MRIHIYIHIVFLMHICIVLCLFLMHIYVDKNTYVVSYSFVYTFFFF